MYGDTYSADSCWTLIGWEYMCSPPGYTWSFGQHLYCPDGVSWVWVGYSGHALVPTPHPPEYECETWSLDYAPGVNDAVFSLWY